LKADELKRELLLPAAYVIVAGLLVFVAWTDQTSLIGLQPVWLLSLLLLGGLGFWFEIAIDPYGTLNLSPIVFLVTASAYGTTGALVVAALAPVTGLLIRRVLGSPFSGSLRRLAAGGEATLALWLGGRLVGFSIQGGEGQLGELMRLSSATLLMSFGLMAVRVAFLERISLSRLFIPLGRRAFPHLLAMLAAMPIVWLAFRLIGPLGIILSVVVVIETYYPWKLLGEQRELFLKSLQMFSNAVDVKDPYTAHHSKRVAAYSVRLARFLGASEDEVNGIRIGALMHDIGKIAVPGNIIRKPSKLTDDEMNLMRGHVGAGASLIEGLDVLENSKDIVQHHHENYDGTGYPSGIVGSEIPLGSRIVFVADAFDALTTDRPYRKGKTRAEAIGILAANAGSQFDPKVVEALTKMLGADV